MSVTETGTRGSRPGELHRRRVVLVAESAGLAGVLNHLLDPADRLSRLGSLRELAGSRALDTAGAVVLDLPAADRAAAVAQVRRRFQGPLVVVAGRTDAATGPWLDDASTLLVRPFSIDELGAALAAGGRPRAAAPGGPPPAPAGAPARPTPARRARPIPARADLLDRAQRLLATLAEGWQARRQVRVAGISAFALVAFTVAFAVAQGGCGPGCDDLGTVVSPARRIDPVSSRAPSTTGPRRPTTTTTATVSSPATGAFGGISAGRAGTTTTTRRATTTTDEPTTSSTRPPTTRPPTSQTTAPTTTRPGPTTTIPPGPTTTAPAAAP